MKKLLFFVLVCGVMSACGPYEERDYISKDIIPSLNNNELVYFQDSANSKKIDTYSIEIKESWHLTTMSYNLQYIGIFYNKLNTKISFFDIALSAGTRFVLVDYEDQGLYNNPYDIKNNFTLNAVTYPTVFIGHYTKPDYNADTIPNNVYFTYKKGIIRYEYKDGRVYNLVSK